MTLPRVMATFRPQAWINNWAVDIDGKAEFDATDKVLALTTEQIRNFQHHNYDSDDLAEDLPQRQEHSGPFEVDVDLDEFLERHGVDDRRELTEEQWQQIRGLYEKEAQ